MGECGVHQDIGGCSADIAVLALSNAQLYSQCEIWGGNVEQVVCTLPGVQLHIRLKSEISVVFGSLKAAVDELPKETSELTSSTLREADSLAAIY